MSESIHFAAKLLLPIIGNRQCVDTIAIGIDFAIAAVRFAEFVLDDAHLLAQVALALAAVDRRLNLPLQVAIDGCFAEVSLDPVDEEFDALDRIHGFEQQLFFFEREVDERRQQIGERVRSLGRVHPQNVEQFIRIFVVALDEFLEERHRLVHEVIGLDRLRNRSRRNLAQARFEVRFALQHLHELHALAALQEELIAIG